MTERAVVLLRMWNLAVCVVCCMRQALDSESSYNVSGPLYALLDTG